MKRPIYTSSITAPRRITFLHLGLAIVIDGYSGEIVGIYGATDADYRSEDLTDAITKRIALLDQGAAGIAQAVELIERWLGESVERAQFYMQHPYVCG